MYEQNIAQLPVHTNDANGLPPAIVNRLLHEVYEGDWDRMIVAMGRASLKESEICTGPDEMSDALLGWALTELGEDGDRPGLTAYDELVARHIVH